MGPGKGVWCTAFCTSYCGVMYEVNALTLSGACAYATDPSGKSIRKVHLDVPSNPNEVSQLLHSGLPHLQPASTALCS